MMTGNTGRSSHLETEAAVNPLDLLQGPAVIVLFPLFMLALLRIIAPNGIDLDEMLQLPMDPGWPRRVQEEEPVRWRVELLSRRGGRVPDRSARMTVQDKAVEST
jgi:hypothetical protein